MKRAKWPFLLLLAISLFLILPSAHAESTTISNLQYPTHTTACESPCNAEPISVSATVSYRDVAPNSSLAIAVVDVNRNSTVVGGFAMRAAPTQCVNLVGAYAQCLVRPVSGSGTEDITFEIGGIFTNYALPAGIWELNFTAVVYDQANKIVPSSVSGVRFQIALSSIILTVVAPSTVNVTIDNVTMPAGATQFPVSAGQHNVTVPLIAPVNDTVRMKFDHWDDGTNATSRLVYVRGDTQISADYAPQYHLTIIGDQGGATGGGWYDPGSNAKFGITTIQQSIGGLLGLLGGKQYFEGWYENGNLLTTQTSGSIFMNSPRTITVEWRQDYSEPLTILGIVAVIAVAVVVTTFFLTRKRSKRTSGTTRRRRASTRKKRRSS